MINNESLSITSEHAGFYSYLSHSLIPPNDYIVVTDVIFTNYTNCSLNGTLGTVCNCTGVTDINYPPITITLNE